MGLYEVEHYRDHRGLSPFELFVEAQPRKVRMKIERCIGLLREQGPDLHRPFSDSLRDGIRELRCLFAGTHYRAFYFFFHGRKIIITHGIIKKTAAVPDEEIERALRYKTDYEQRQGL